MTEGSTGFKRKNRNLRRRSGMEVYAPKKGGWPSFASYRERSSTPFLPVDCYRVPPHCCCLLSILLSIFQGVRPLFERCIKSGTHFFQSGSEAFLAVVHLESDTKFRFSSPPPTKPLHDCRQLPLFGNVNGPYPSLIAPIAEKLHFLVVCWGPPGAPGGPSAPGAAVLVGASWRGLMRSSD